MKGYPRRAVRKGIVLPDNCCNIPLGSLIFGRVLSVSAR